MIAIGPETFHGQHRGTGAGLQNTFNRVAGIMVSLFPSSLLSRALILIDDGELIDFIGIDHCIKSKSEDCGSCLCRGCFHDLWWDACVVDTV